MTDAVAPHERQFAALVGTVAAAVAYLVLAGPPRFLVPFAVGLVVWRAVIYARSSGLWTQSLPKREVDEGRE